MTTKKPQPTPEIISSAKAEAKYNADVELWGDALQASGVRLCKWFNEQGAKFDCDGDGKPD